MRGLVYAARALALCAGTAEAFVSPPAATIALGWDVNKAQGGRAAPGSRQQVRMGAAESTSEEDARAVMARVNALMEGQSVVEVTSSMEAAYGAPAASNSGTHSVLHADVPAERREQPPAEDAAAAMARAARQAGTIESPSESAPTGRKIEYGISGCASLLQPPAAASNRTAVACTEAGSFKTDTCARVEAGMTQERDQRHSLPQLPSCHVLAR